MWLCVAAHLPGCRADPKPDTAKVATTPSPPLLLTGPQLQALADIAERTLRDYAGDISSKGTPGSSASAEALPKRLAEGKQIVHATLRSSGALIATGSATGELAAATQQAIQAATSTLDAPTAQPVDTMVLNIAHTFVVAPHNEMGPHLTNRRRGVRGIVFQRNGSREIVPPTHMLARGTSFANEFELYRKRHNLRHETFTNEVEISRFEAQQVLIKLDPQARAAAMFRGNDQVPAAAVTQASTRLLARRAGDWLASHVHHDGRVTYTWFPGRGEESEDNNMIRQWMASVCLVRWARFRGESELHALSTKNIAYNLDHFYREEAGHGHIEYQGRADLGAMSLAALAIHESAAREQFSTQETGLRATIDSLWRDDGSFWTRYKPNRTTGGENYYPGETLLYWSALYKESRDPERLARFMKSFRHYKKWHLNEANRAPAFVPWHTQAYYQVWLITHDDRLRDFIFTMNDWLVRNMQRWKNVPYADAAGRFYNPARSKWGSANASSTGVYIEGLADAYALAKEVGDAQREERYRLSLARAIRSLLQIQIVDEVDTFYMIRPERAIGGIRTSVYRDFIRVDNVQHNLMGLIKIQQRFQVADYKTD